MSERLLLDAMLGKLATYLRMCGYDAAYVLDRDVADEQSGTDGDPSDDDIAAWAERSTRTLLTRDVDLAARVDDAVLLSSRDVREQLRSLYDAGYELSLEDPPRRCSACNGVLRAVDADESLPAYAPDPAETYCWRCRECGQAFWKGSHWDDVAATLADVRK
ncbi:Mut7-C RNAse domain-containing protein [Halobellus litoreus]|uniref:Mut7-C RNAse domain-containing protein n=1 Tax=Halobellus litoreus TaxID=755310 RepID=A0ABD6DQL6_9EURY|nr:Mut7-C RNAse domain-containing protein [Halobellus litoreus]